MYTVIEGLNPHSIHLALELLELQARVLIIDNGISGTDYPQQLPCHPFGLKMLSLDSDQELKNKSEDFFQPIIQKFLAEGILKNAKVQNVGKKYLAHNELTGSRMQDLFRVTSLKDMSVEQTLEIDDEGKLSQDFNASMKMKREDFDDCDFYIDAFGKRACEKSYPIVNHKILSEDESIFNDYKDEKLATGHTTLVGDGLRAANLILNNKQWFFDLNNHLDIVTTSSVPFEKIKGSPEHKNVMSFFSELESHLNKEFEEYRRYVFDCRESMKKPNRPEPKESLSFFMGYSALLLDKLYDRTNYYITIEKPSFRGELDLKTLCADTVFFLINKNDQELGAKEEGFFLIDSSMSIESETTRLKDEMLRYFSRND